MTTFRLFLVAGLVCFSFVNAWAQLPNGVDPFGAPAPPSRMVERALTTTAEESLRQARRAGTTVEHQIRQELNTKTSFSFIEEPLESAIRLIGETHDIPILVNRNALEAIGLTPDTPVTANLKNLTLRSFLRLVLRDYELTYMIRDEVLQITTVDDAERNSILHAYVLPKMLADNSEQVLEAMFVTVQPSTWSKQGGSSSARLVRHVLLVSASDNVHESVVDFLDKLQEAFENNATAP